VVLSGRIFPQFNCDSLGVVDLSQLQLMIDHIEKKRVVLGIDKARERILVDMADRRQLESA